MSSVLRNRYACCSSRRAFFRAFFTRSLVVLTFSPRYSLLPSARISPSRRAAAAGSISEAAAAVSTAGRSRPSGSSISCRARAVNRPRNILTLARSMRIERAGSMTNMSVRPTMSCRTSLDRWRRIWVTTVSASAADIPSARSTSPTQGGTSIPGPRARTLRFLAPRRRRDSNVPGGPDGCAPASGGSPFCVAASPAAFRSRARLAFAAASASRAASEAASAAAARLSRRACRRAMPSPTRSDTRADGGSDTGRSSGETGSFGGGGGGSSPAGSPDRTTRWRHQIHLDTSLPEASRAIFPCRDSRGRSLSVTRNIASSTISGNGWSPSQDHGMASS